MKFVYSIVCLIALLIGLFNIDYSDYCIKDNFNSYIIIFSSIILWCILMIIKLVKFQSKIRRRVSVFILIYTLFGLSSLGAIIISPNEPINYLYLILALFGIIHMSIICKHNK